MYNVTYVDLAAVVASKNSISVAQFDFFGAQLVVSHNDILIYTVDDKRPRGGIAMGGYCRTVGQGGRESHGSGIRRES